MAVLASSQKTLHINVMHSKNTKATLKRCWQADNTWEMQEKLTV